MSLTPSRPVTGLIDTARKYGTEECVGEGIRASGIARADLWVTTKVTRKKNGARGGLPGKSAETSLKTLGLDYVDLLLVHWPQPNVPLAETLGALAKAKRQGLTRHIGVSNYTIAMLDEAVHVCPEPLVTNQIEYHAYLPQDRMIAALRKHGMILTAYCPVARGELLGDPVVNEVAKAHNKTAAQVCLLWLIQQPMVAAVPRALEEAHIDQNLDVFTDFALSADEMKKLFALRSSACVLPIRRNGRRSGTSSRSDRLGQNARDVVEAASSSTENFRGMSFWRKL